MAIEVKGEELRVVVNDKVIIDIKLAAELVNGLIPPGLSRAKGWVGLQVHTGTVHFRNVEIAELPRTKTEDQGFVPLFNGKDFTGWRTHPSPPGNWPVEKGILTGSSDGVSHLYTDRGDYTNFHLRLDAPINVGGEFKAPGYVSPRSALTYHPT